MNDDDDESDSDDLDGFLVGEHNDDIEDEEYDPNTDRTLAKKQRTKVPAKNKRKLRSSRNQRNNRVRESALKSSGIYGDEEEDITSNDEDDIPISANMMRRKQSKQKRPVQPMSFSNGHSNGYSQRKRGRNTNDDRQLPNRKRAKASPSSKSTGSSSVATDLSEHLKDLFNGKISRSNRSNGLTHKNKAGTTAPDGTVIPTSKLPSNYKRTVSRGGGSSKLSKLRKNHKNSMLAANIAAKENTFSVRKNDRSKSGHFRKRNGGAIILGMNNRPLGKIPKIPKQARPPTVSNVVPPLPTKPTPKGPVHKPLKQKMPVKRMDNTLFKQQHKRNHNSNGYNHSNSNMHHNGRANYRGNRVQSKSERRDCQLEFIGKILKWTPLSVESALGDVEADLVPICDSYDSAMEYKKLFAPFLFEEVRASIAQRLEEKQRSRLIRRQRQDPSKNQWKKHERRDETWYDVVRVANYGYNPTANVTTLTFHAIDQHMRLNKTYYSNQLVILVQDCNLTQSKGSNIVRIKDIMKYGIFGIVGHSHDRDPFVVHIDAQSTAFRNEGTLVGMIFIDSLTSSFREFQCLSTMPDNDWAPKIIKPRNITPIDDMTLTEIRDRQLPQWMRSKLNEGQQNAVAAALVKELNVTLIKGPPGTGKTTTIVSLINAALLGLGFLEKTQRPKILVCAPSNAAIDVVLERSLKNMKSKSGDNKLNVKMVRIGSGTTNATAKKIHIDALLDPRHKLNRLEKELAEVEVDKSNVTKQWKDLNRICRGGGGNEQEKNKMKHLADKLKRIQNRKNALRKDLENERKSDSNSRGHRVDKTELIRDHDVVFGTLSAAALSFMNRVHFDLLIIDEATQSKEISTLIPFQLNIRSIVLVGDEKQLPATVISKSCADFGFAKSFFERCLDNKVEPYLLSVQYRMHTEIQHWPNATFYDSKLVDGPNIARDIIPRMAAQQRDPRLSPYAFFDLVKSRSQEEQTEGKSFRNLAELDFILRLLDYMSKRFYQNPKHFKSVGIVTPYSGQVAYFKKHIAQHRNKALHSVVVNTVESFQGNEKDIIIFSCVRSQKEPERATKERAIQNLGFITDTRRLNVALTRARLCCFIVGNSLTLRADKTWKALMHDAHLRGRVFTVDSDHKVWLSRRSEQLTSSLHDERLKLGTIPTTTPGGPDHHRQSNGHHQSNGDDRKVEIASASNVIPVPMDLDGDSSSSSCDRSKFDRPKSSSISCHSSASSSKSSSRSRSRSRDDGHHHKRSHHRNPRDRNSRSRHKRDRSRDRGMDVDRQYGRNQGHRRSGHHYKTSDAEIAKMLNLPPPPTDPRLRRQK